MEQALSKAAYRLSGQPMFQILSKIKEMERAGTHVIHFEIGDPDFATPTCVSDAAKQALDDGWTHYSASIGDYDLRQAVCDTQFFTPAFRPDIDQVLIAPGAIIMICSAIRCLAEAGDEVIIPDPSFSTYESALDFCDVKAIHLPLREENEFKIRASDVERLVTDKTRMIIVNSPNNPTGAVTSKENLEAVGKLCLDRGIYLFCDEIYSRLNYTGQSLYSPSILDRCKERMFIATGFSKAFAMTGWRLGVGIGPEQLIAKMALLLETTSSCTPTFIQRAGITAIQKGEPDIDKMVKVYQKRRDYLVERLNRIPGVHCAIPEGAFYVFPSIRELGLSSGEFADRLLREGHVGVCPGNYFGACGEGFIRLCYAASMEDIREGMDRLERFVGSL